MVCSKCKKTSICQSCSMPLKNKTDLGTNLDGSCSYEYCCHCFKNGKFTETLTREEMIQNSETLMKKMKMSQEAIDEVKALLPTLKRWK